MMHTSGNVVALSSSGQQNYQMRFGAEKYAKFVYSSRYGFSIEADERAYTQAAFDGMIGFSDDGRHYRVREEQRGRADRRQQALRQWKPWPDVTVETWLRAGQPVAYPHPSDRDAASAARDRRRLCDCARRPRCGH